MEGFKTFMKVVLVVGCVVLVLSGLATLLDNYRTEVALDELYVSRPTHPFGGWASYGVNIVSGEEVIKSWAMPTIAYDRYAERIVSVEGKGVLLIFNEDGTVTIKEGEVEETVPLSSIFQSKLDKALEIRNERWEKYGHLLDGL